MADRYWVGGTANWDTAAGSKWATTSGGTGGASVPTILDDVFFTDLSTGTCTIGSNFDAKSINCTGFTGTITGIGGMSVAGSITLSSGMTYTHTGTLTITGTGTLTTAGKAFSAVTINATGITVSLGDALNVGIRSLQVIRGTFNTVNFAVTATSLIGTGTTTRTINLGSSTVTLLGSAPVDFTTTTNLTFIAGTSQINLSPSTFMSFNGNSLTFHNVSISAGSGLRTITGTNSFNNLTLNVNTGSALITELVLNNNQTVNGTFSIAGTTAIRRGFIRSNTLGSTRTITAAAISAPDCDFRNITLAGAASGSSPTRAGDCGGNSGITFPAAKTVFWNLAGTQEWSAIGWATSDGGAPQLNNFPLAQDTATFTNTGNAGTVNLSLAFNTGTIDASGRTSAMTLNHNAGHNIYGNYSLNSGVTISGTSTLLFCGHNNTQTFTCGGRTITYPINTDKPAGGAFTLGDAFLGTNIFNLLTGAFNANNNNVTCQAFRSNNTAVRTLTMGSGLWTITGVGTGAGAPWSLQNTNMTVNVNSANILLSDTSTSNRQFGGGTGVAYNRVTIGGTTGTSATFISAGPTINELASTKTVAHSISSTGTLGIGTWLVTGSAGNLVTVSGFTLNLTNVTNNINYLAVQSLTVSNPNRFYVGANSVNNGSNTNVIFTATPTGGEPTSNMLLLFS